MSQEIFLSFDASQRKGPLQLQMKKLATLAAGELDQSVRPVTVIPKKRPLNARALEGLKKFFGGGRRGPLGTSAETLEVLRSHESSLASQVEALIGSAKKTKASCIVVGTRGKEWTLRGAFSEKLVRESSVPILLVNSKMQVPKALRKIVFASDLSAHSLETFRKLCDFAVAADAEVKLVSAIIPSWVSPLESTSLAATMLMTDEDFDRMTADDVKLALKKVKPFATAAKKRGVKFGVEVLPTLGSRSETVLKVSTKWNADVIALGAGASGTLHAHLFGSTPLALIRKSTRPLWIYRAK